MRFLPAAIERFLSPGFGCCFRCNRPWRFAKDHITVYSSTGAGCFPLCEPCWSKLTPEERLPHYRALFSIWGPDHGGWEEIKAAVLAGK